MGLALIAGCNQLIGFKDVKLEGDGGTGSDAHVDDASKDAATDGPPPNLFTFVTDASFIGGFGATNGARVTADIKCQDKYTMSFSSLGCTNIHAVIQVDDTVDSLARMKITFPIPLTSEVKRATDATPVINNWDAFVNPNVQLMAPISTGAPPQLFWSGRGVGSNLQCTNWTSSSSSVFGNAGDATKTNAWTSQANVTCDNFDEHLVCVCW
ncbi:MAG TPA: hypothetical protein VGO00_22295 [Kofleriaceae bacterium]|jgi:hypothetical protein|nr:hypothetical protein [Kofleriaceae bacterium]